MKSGDLYCKAISCIGLPEFIRAHGGNPELMFEQSGLNIAHIHTNDFYDWTKLCDLFTRVEHALNVPSLGIRFAYKVPIDFLNTGPMLMLAALVPTMRDFFILGPEYQKLHINSFSYHYTENIKTDQVECELRVHPLSPPCLQFTEHIMAVIALMIRHNFGEGYFNKVTFQHKAPADLSWHEEIFQCPIEFNADKTISYMPLDFLDMKLDGRLGGRLRKLQPIVKNYLNRKINKSPLFSTSIAHTVERLLPSIFGIRKSSMIDVARILDISPKKLQRLLNEEEATFSDIVNNVRQSMAKRLLIESDIAVSHIAVLLDYASSEAFNTACKIWFGVSPSQYRIDVRAQGAPQAVINK